MREEGESRMFKKQHGKRKRGRERDRESGREISAKEAVNGQLEIGTYQRQEHLSLCALFPSPSLPPSMHSVHCWSECVCVCVRQRKRNKKE